MIVSYEEDRVEGEFGIVYCLPLSTHKSVTITYLTGFALTRF